MLKNIASVTAKFENWESQWLLANETPTNVCKALLYQYLNYIDQVEIQNAERQKQMEEAAAAEKANDPTVLEAQPIEVISE